MGVFSSQYGYKVTFTLRTKDVNEHIAPLLVRCEEREHKNGHRSGTPRLYKDVVESPSFSSFPPLFPTPTLQLPKFYGLRVWSVSPCGYLTHIQIKDNRRER